MEKQVNGNRFCVLVNFIGILYNWKNRNIHFIYKGVVFNMAFDGIVIANLVHDIRQKLEGGKINKIAQPRRMNSCSR